MNHDIDLFFIANDVYVHAASAGGVLPNQINDDEALRETQYQVEQLPDIYTDEDIEYNELSITNAIGGNDEIARRQYIESFTAMARKGFVSFDRSNLLDPNDNQYHLVCKPRIVAHRIEGLNLITLNENNLVVSSNRGLTSISDYIRRDLLNNSKE